MAGGWFLRPAKPAGVTGSTGSGRVKGSRRPRVPERSEERSALTRERTGDTRLAPTTSRRGSARLVLPAERFPGAGACLWITPNVRLLRRGRIRQPKAINGQGLSPWAGDQDTVLAESTAPTVPGGASYRWTATATLRVTPLRVGAGRDGSMPPQHKAPESGEDRVNGRGPQPIPVLTLGGGSVPRTLDRPNGRLVDLRRLLAERTSGAWAP